MRLRVVSASMLATAITIGAGSLYAQGIITGSVTGTVEDPSGAVVPNAQIMATNLETGIVQTAKSGGAGDFSIGNLPVGTYKLVITSPGFTDLKLENVKVESGRETGLGAEKLATGGAAETVQVSTGASLLETVQSQVSTVFTAEQIADLPLNQGFDKLALLIPGVVATRSNNFANTNGTGISSNGQRGRSNNFEIDGQSNNDNSVSGPQVFFSNQDALQEVQIVTDNFSAQYGRDAGTVVNYVTKSGTNEIHGSAFEFYAGSWLNSLTQGQKSPFQNFCPPGVAAGTNGCTPVKKPRYTDNDYGGTLGGPIIKDKLFGFGSALFQRNFAGAAPSVSGSGTNGYFPTPAAIQQLAAAYPNNPGVQSLVAYNPFTIAAGNPVGIGTPVTVNVSNGTTTTPIQVQQYSRFLPSYNTDEEVLGRLDYQATPKDRFYVRYFYQNEPTIAGSGTIYTGGFVNVADRVHSVGADLTHTFTPNLTNQLRYSFQQSSLIFDGGGFANCTINSLSVCPSQLSVSNGTPTPVVGATSTVNIGNFGLANNLPQSRIVKDTQVQDNANYVIGRHNFTIGGAFEYQNSPNVFLPTVSGSYTFGSTGTGTTIPALNGLLQGVTPLSLAAGNPNIHFTEPDWAVYVQDDWKVTPSFTANLGLRWEYFTSSINLLRNVSVATQTSPTPLWNTALPQSATTFPSVAEDYKHFEPRLGFAYNPVGARDLVIRGGYSVNIAPAFYNIFLNSYGSAPVVLSTTITNCNNAAKACIPTGGSNEASVQAQDIKFLPLGGNPGSFNQTLVPSNFRQPYTQTYSLGAQYEFAQFFVVEARYVGAHTVGDFQSLNANPQLATVAAAFPNVVNPASLCTAATSQLAGGTDIGHLHCGQTNVRLRANTAYEIYNGLQTKFTTRNYHGLTANASYTFSRTVDNASEVFSTDTGGSTIAFAQNPLNSNESERGVSGDSFPNVTAVGLNYVDPHFKSNHSFVGRALGGFQFNTLYVFNSGQPYTPYQSVGDRGGSFCDSSFNSAFAGGDTCRPVLSNPNAPLGTVGYNAGSGVYRDRATGAQIAPSAVHFLINNTAEALTLGNPFPGVGRNTLRGTTYNNVDASVFKNNKLTERLNLQLQFQMFNALNRAFYGIPDPLVDDSGVTGTFANVKGMPGTRRTTTLGGRILF